MEKITNLLLSMTPELIVASVISFLATAKPGLIGYTVFESYRAWKGVVYSVKGYIFRFFITLGVIYMVNTVLNIGNIESRDVRELVMFLTGGFSFAILDIVDQKFPGLLKQKANQILDKHN